MHRFYTVCLLSVLCACATTYPLDQIAIYQDGKVITQGLPGPEKIKDIPANDLVQSGGTLRECRVALMAAGAKTVSAFVTHAVFPRASWEKFLIDPATGNETVSGQRGFKSFIVADSVPSTVAAIEGKAPFEVLSLSTSLVSLLV